MEVRKLIEKSQDGAYEIQKWHIVEINIDQEELIDFCDYPLGCWDDGEMSAGMGVYMDFNGDPFCIEFRKFLKELRDKVDDENYDEDKEKIESWIKKLQMYDGYTLYFKIE